MQAAKKMSEAAEFYEKTPAAMRLRELQTLAEIAREKNLIVVPGGEMGNIAGIAKAVNKYLSSKIKGDIPTGLASGVLSLAYLFKIRTLIRSFNSVKEIRGWFKGTNCWLIA